MNVNLLQKLTSVRVWMIAVGMGIWITGFVYDPIGWKDVSITWVGAMMAMYFTRDRSHDTPTADSTKKQ